MGLSRYIQDKQQQTKEGVVQILYSLILLVSDLFVVVPLDYNMIGSCVSKLLPDIYLEC